MAHYKGAASEGGRAQILMKKRQKEQEELEHKKKKIEEDLNVGSIQNKFATHYDAIEQQLKSNTIGTYERSQFQTAEIKLDRYRCTTTSDKWPLGLSISKIDTECVKRASRAGASVYVKAFIVKVNKCLKPFLLEQHYSILL